MDGALAVAGLADSDVAKAMLVQKAMTATGVTPEVMAQVGEAPTWGKVGIISVCYKIEKYVLNFNNDGL